MAKYNYLLKTITALVSILLIYGCNNTAKKRIKYNFANANKFSVKKLHGQFAINSNSELEEYINRIGKRIILVTATPSKAYKFKLDDSRGPRAYITNKNIFLSKGLLILLKSEAELASVISYLLTNNSSKLISKKDKLAMSYMFYADYNPQATITMQQRWLNDPNLIKNNFFKNFYPIYKQRLDNLQNLANTYPKGLKIGKGVYEAVIHELNKQNYYQ